MGVRSPFPGMDPYLEEPGGWAGVHDALIATMREALNREIGPNYVADGGATVYVLTPEERRWLYPAVFLIEAATAAASSTGRAAITAPVRISLEAPEEIRQPFVLIRDRASREVVTILELLSPINKMATERRGRTGARQEFLRKRSATLASHTHWIEIDLLRAGERPPEARGAGDYYALLRRAGSRDAELWPFGIRDSLPTIAVPLRAPDADAPLDLQSAIRTLFERYRYAELLDYAADPPPPPFPLDDARWIAEQLARWRAENSPPGRG